VGVYLYNGRGATIATRNPPPGAGLRCRSPHQLTGDSIAGSFCWLTLDMLLRGAGFFSNRAGMLAGGRFVTNLRTYASQPPPPWFRIPDMGWCASGPQIPPHTSVANGNGTPLPPLPTNLYLYPDGACMTSTGPPRPSFVSGFTGKGCQRLRWPLGPTGPLSDGLWRLKQACAVALAHFLLVCENPPVYRGKNCLKPGFV